MANHNLIMTDYYRQANGGALRCKFRFNAERLQWWRPNERGWRDVSADDMLRRIGKLPEDEWVDLHVFATLDRETAIAMGSDVVGAILPVLRALAPVYEMTIAG
jgi:hypothetical protein